MCVMKVELLSKWFTTFISTCRIENGSSRKPWQFCRRRHSFSLSHARIRNLNFASSTLWVLITHGEREREKLLLTPFFQMTRTMRRVYVNIRVVTMVRRREIFYLFATITHLLSITRVLQLWIDSVALPLSHRQWKQRANWTIFSDTKLKLNYIPSQRY